MCVKDEFIRVHIASTGILTILTSEEEMLTSMYTSLLLNFCNIHVHVYVYDHKNYNF